MYAQKKGFSIYFKCEFWENYETKLNTAIVKNLDILFINKMFFTYSNYFERAQTLPTVGLNMCKTLKKMLAQAEHIFDTFEYFWVYHKSNFFCNCLATRWRHLRFCWKLEFWAENFFWWILLEKELLLGNFGSIFCPRMDLKCPKTRTHFVAKSTVKQSSF